MELASACDAWRLPTAEGACYLQMGHQVLRLQGHSVSHGCFLRPQTGRPLSTLYDFQGVFMLALANALIYHNHIAVLCYTQLQA